MNSKDFMKFEREGAGGSVCIYEYLNMTEDVIAEGFVGRL